MIHGNIQKSEPNLVPMLDVVLQLIMFFMLCANFLMEDVNADVKLPAALQAKPLDRAEEYVIFLNMNKDGHVLPPKTRSRDAHKLTNPVQVRSYMKGKFDIDQERQRQARERGRPVPKPSLVVLRADQDCTFKQVNDVLIACRQAGYTDVQLRAIVGSGR